MGATSRCIHGVRPAICKEHMYLGYVDGVMLIQTSSAWLRQSSANLKIALSFFVLFPRLLLFIELFRFPAFSGLFGNLFLTYTNR